MPLYKNVSLKEISNWKVGGKLDILYIVDDIIELKNALHFFQKSEIPFIVVGNTTNLLFSDEDIKGGLIKLGSGFDFCNFDGLYVEVGCASYIPYFIRNCVNKGLEGLEHLIGVPATIGGGVYMNAGSQRKSIASNITEITSINFQGEVIVRKVSDCNFSYRTSIYQSLPELIISAKLKLNYANKAELRTNCLKILRDRSKKFPRKQPSCGSVFISNPNMYDQFGPPGKIIENVGLKGYKIGGASISSQHANFIVNDGDAKAVDILSLMATAIEKVEAETGFRLESEAKYVSEDCLLINADTAALTLIN
ncbi:MAG: UDP-N-acetylmuramate dehydrogenase [Mariniflexile sp.]|jgi:UDP-N-acetylmuramate dehydrogenase